MRNGTKKRLMPIILSVVLILLVFPLSAVAGSLPQIDGDIDAYGNVSWSPYEGAEDYVLSFDMAGEGDEVALSSGDTYYSLESWFLGKESGICSITLTAVDAEGTPIAKLSGNVTHEGEATEESPKEEFIEETPEDEPVTDEATKETPVVEETPEEEPDTEETPEEEPDTEEEPVAEFFEEFSQGAMSAYAVNVSVQASSGGSAQADKESADVNDTVTITATPESGYRLVSIVVNEGAVTVDENHSFTMPEGIANVAVTFEAIPTHTVTVTVNDIAMGSATTTPADTAMEGETVTVNATPESGYRLVSIVVDEGGPLTGNTFEMPNTDVTVTVTFEAIPEYDISLTVNDETMGSASVVPADKAEEGETVTVTATPESGYRLVSIVVNEGAVTVDENHSFTMPEGIANVAVTFEAIPTHTVTVTVNDIAMGSASTSPADTAMEGETVTITATPESGYRLVSIVVNEGGPLTGNTFEMPNTDVTVTVTFEAIPKYDISLTVNDETMGSATTSPADTAMEGETVTVNATPENGYRLVSIVVDEGGPLTGNTFEMPNTDVTVTVTFEAIPEYDISLTVNDETMGSASVVPADKAEEGETVTVTATPNEGYILIGITVNDGVINGNSFSMPAEAANIMVSFAKEVKVTAKASPSYGGTVSGDGTYAEGDSVTLKAKANKGFNFLRWSENGETVSTDKEYTFTATENRKLTAIFKMDRHAHYVTVFDSQANDDGEGIYYEGEKVYIHAGRRAGYLFDGWRARDLKIRHADDKDAYFIMPDRDVKVFAQWEKKGVHSDEYAERYIIEVTANKGGSASPEGKVSTRHGATRTIAFEANAGYEIAKVLVDGKNVGAPNSYTFKNVDDDHTVEVFFRETKEENPNTGLNFAPLSLAVLAIIKKIAH